MNNLKVTSFSSKGRVSRIKSLKNKKIYHLQSDLQLKIFIILEWYENVIDIVVNHKLDNLIDNLDDVSGLRLYKFMDEYNNIYSIHTNFLITFLINNEISKVAVSVRQFEDLDKSSTIEKLEIERRYWREKGVNFYIITDKEINNIFYDNIMRCRDTVINSSIQNKEEKAELLINYIIKHKELTIKSIINQYEEELDLDNGEGIFLFKFLLYTKRIAVDMTREINMNQKGKDLLRRGRRV